MKKVTVSQLGGSFERFDGLIKMFGEHFNSSPSRFFSAPGEKGAAMPSVAKVRSSSAPLACSAVMSSLPLKMVETMA